METSSRAQLRHPPRHQTQGRLRRRLRPARRALGRDPERRHLNELLLGEDRELREIVAERVREEGIWRRRDSVEVVEVLLTATRAHFLDDGGELDEARVRRWEGKNVAWLREKYGDLMLKAVSHRDERTPRGGVEDRDRGSRDRSSGDRGGGRSSFGGR